MVARRAANIRLATFACVSAVILGCSDATTGNQRAAVLLRLSTSASAVASGPPPRPFVGILDSLDVVVSSSGAPMTHFGQRLTAADTGEITHPLGVVEGSIAIVARILSANGTVLHGSTESVTVSKAGGVIDIVLQPLTPIMLASPDTLRVNTLSTQAVNDSFKVYNRGIDFVSWILTDVQPPPPSIRNCAINCMRPRGSSSKGIVAAGDSLFVHIDSIYNVAGPVRFTLTSAQGSISVVVMRR